MRPFHAFFLLMCSIPLALSHDMIGSIPRQIMFRGIPQGGTITIGSIANPTIQFSVSSVAGETLDSAINKFVSLQVPDESPIAGFVSSAGGKLTLVTQPGLVFVRTTDPGLKPAAPPANLRAQPIKAAAEVRLSWTYLKGSPPQVRVFRGLRIIATLDGESLSYVDKNYGMERISELTYRVVTFDADASGTIIPGDMVEVLTTSPDHLVSDAFSITPSAIPTAVVGRPFELSFQKNAGVDPVTWKLSAGALPAGLVLTQSGTLGGTPTAMGVANATIAIVDATGATATLPLSMEVKALPTLQTLIHENQTSLPGGHDHHDQ
jgi:hypothetical protein